MNNIIYPIREKKHRLDEEVYSGGIFVSITACVKNRKKLFVNDRIFKVFESIILKELKTNNCSSYVYLFMADHSHIILSGDEVTSNCKKCFDKIKQKTGFWLSKNLKDVKWQKDYYDHILRSNENLYVQVKYILNNPVRAGLVNFWKKYPYKGSTVYNFDEWD
jgi:REP element-mobilizing transposase RayT